MFHQNNLHDYDGQGHSLLSDTYVSDFHSTNGSTNCRSSATLDQLGRTCKIGMHTTCRPRREPHGCRWIESDDQITVLRRYRSERNHSRSPA